MNIHSTHRPDDRGIVVACMATVASIAEVICHTAVGAGGKRGTAGMVRCRISVVPVWQTIQSLTPLVALSVVPEVVAVPRMV